jgi:prepilin-type N-terminal cleavage/methylation domain-containing protein
MNAPSIDPNETIERRHADRRGRRPNRLGRRAAGGSPSAIERLADRSRHQGAQGFTLIELMIVVVIIGVIAAIAIPNFIAMQKRANEGSVKANMHTVQMSVEDFSLQNDGVYPVSAAATTMDGRTLSQVCPTNGYPRNPYTHVATVVLFNADPTLGNKGELSLNPAVPSSYIIKGNGSNGTALPLTLTSGQ